MHGYSLNQMTPNQAVHPLPTNYPELMASNRALPINSGHSDYIPYNSITNNPNLAPSFYGQPRTDYRLQPTMQSIFQNPPPLNQQQQVPHYPSSSLCSVAILEDKGILGEQRDVTEADPQQLDITLFAESAPLLSPLPAQRGQQ